MGDISGILFFLLSAMVIVELIDAHDGFYLVSSRIKTTKIRSLFWIIAILAFFLSAILDNLTTTIVMVSLVRKLIEEPKKRFLFAGVIVIAANAGGAWSPIGDVTTTMLWIGGQISALNIIKSLFLPSLVCIVVPLIILSFRFKGKLDPKTVHHGSGGLTSTKFERSMVFYTGLGSLIFVPIFKMLTHLPPFMGILIALGFMWIITEIIHSGKDIAERKPLSVASALQKIDTSSILFFLGILLAIAGLQSAEILNTIAVWMQNTLGNDTNTAIVLGLSSAVVDNVPLVAAAQGMYGLEQFPQDHYFWEFLAFTTGTGGSTLIIGSAAGVAAMGLEKIDFFWYLRNISFLALVGFLAGALTYILQYNIIHS
jgi:Na+/H+ antiporter NhaD/arsenite permease-like protein